MAIGVFVIGVDVLEPTVRIELTILRLQIGSFTTKLRRLVPMLLYYQLLPSAYLFLPAIFPSYMPYNPYMPPVMKAICANAFFAVNSIIIEQKLGVNQPAAVSLSICVMIVVYIVSAHLMGIITIQLPPESCYKWICISAFLCLCADLLIYGAFHSGGHAISIATCAALYPSMALAARCIWLKEMPLLGHLVSVILAGMAIYVAVTYGVSKRIV